MNIHVPPEIKKEVKEQIWADQQMLGINYSELVFSWLLETMGMEKEELYLE